MGFSYFEKEVAHVDYTIATDELGALRGLSG